MRSDRPRRHGRRPVPRERLRAGFILAIISAQMPMAQIAHDCGFRHPQRFSNLLHAPGVPITARPLFERVARLIRFPADQVFVDTADATPRVMANADEAGA